ncbi:MAG: serine--tRNA ligase [Eubacteriales bacterium]|nr:serine--tRNA ligase [Eubacteriales bacterium]
MLDINLIRENPEKVKKALLKRMGSVDFTELLSWDTKRRELIVETENMKAERNRVSKLIPSIKKEGKDAGVYLSAMKKLSDTITERDKTVSELDGRIHDFMAALPNIPADDVLAGDKENNKVVRIWGDKPEFSFKPKDHVQLVTDLHLIDYERGAKLGGNGFWAYRGNGALLEWALLNYFIETHISDGYEFILPPHLLTWNCGYTAGQFPKFEEDVYRIENGEGQFILPTAETALVNFHRDEILKEDELPKKYFAFTPCYRKEAGSYRSDERGMIRGHQFNKVEMFQYTVPEDSEKALDELIGKAEKLVQGLGLHYRVSKLAAADCSASMGKTFDIEIWIPSMNIYKEVSSASNGYDYQARRGNIRFRRISTGKTEYVHTLNASGLATSRLLPAIVEQLQQEDGSIKVPSVLKKWLNMDTIKA